MATTIRFTEDKRHSNFRLDEFKDMRRYIMLAKGSSIDQLFLYQLVDKLDEVKDMAVGSKVYIMPSEWRCYVGSNIKEIEREWNWFETGKSWSALDEKQREHYRPQQLNAFCIKRTEKLWVVRDLDYEYKF